MADKNEVVRNFEGFVRGNVVNFFDEHELEKLSLQDGFGNKAKLAKDKDGNLIVEITRKDVM